MSWLPSTVVGVADPQTAVNTADIATIEGEQTTQDGLIAANTAKVTNATHTGDVTGDTALTLDSSAVTGQTLVTADASDHVLIADASDSGALKKALVSDLTAGVAGMSESTYDPQTIAGDAFARANHTGTQAASSISDFDTEVSNNASVAANTAKVSYDDTEAAAATAAITTLQSEQSTQDTAIAANTAKTGITAGESAKLAHLTVTQAVDLDSIETRVNELDASVVLMGTWDASAGTFPGSGSASSGQSWIVSVAGTVDGVAFVVNDRLLAIADPASASTYAANWHKLDYTDQVLSVGGLTGAVSAADVVSGGVAGAGTGSVLIKGTAAAGGQAVAVGSNSSAAGTQGVAIGYLSSAAGYISVALGRNTSSTGNYDVSIGYLSSSTGGQGIAIGRQASATGANATAVGYLAEATASGAVAIGTTVVAATANTTSVNNLEVQGSMNVVGGFHPAGERTGASRTLLQQDANRTTKMSNSGLVTVTIPLNSAEPFAIGAQFAIHSTGAGGVTLSTTGITLNGSSPNTTIAQNEIMVLEKTGTDTWSVYGGTSA